MTAGRSLSYWVMCRRIITIVWVGFVVVVAAFRHLHEARRRRRDRQVLMRWFRHQGWVAQ